MNSSAPATPPKDFSALDAQPSPAELRAYLQSARGKSDSGRSAGQIIALVFAAILTVATVGIAAAALRSARSTAPWIVLGLVVVGVVVGLVAWLMWRALQATRLTRYRLAHFARDNGLRYTESAEPPALPGMIFRLGSERRVTNTLDGPAKSRLLTMGSLQYTLGSGKSKRTVSWGYLAFRLDRRLPHIVLDATQNNGRLFGLNLSNLPIEFARDQRLSLEGDFDKHFSLYCPRDYERDALYILTPDVMALLIDNAAPFDVEIVDDLLFVYSAHTDANTYRRLCQVYAAVASKALNQTHRYSDERLEEATRNEVAPAGRRLATSHWRTIILAAAAVGYFVVRLVIERG